MMMAENAGGVRRSLAHDESAREKQTPLTLRDEAQLNCVSLRPEFDCEVTWGAVKGQDERPLRGALDSSPSHHRRSMQLGKELIKDGRHVGLDFLRPSHRSIQTILRVGQDFVSHYALKPRHATEVCQEIALVHTAKQNAKAARTTAPIRKALHRLANLACKPPDVVSPVRTWPVWYDKWSQPRFYLGPRCRPSP